ncbi:MAG TPA: HAD family hydrolase [Candidatus Baltobacteraceae bacterium]
MAHVDLPAHAGALGIGFDFDHTLGIDNKLERVAFLHLLERIQGAGGSPVGTLNEEIERIDALLVAQRSGACSIEAAVERYVRAHGIDDVTGYVDAYKTIALASVEAFVVPLPGVASLLGQLRTREIPYAILTNGWSPLQQRKAACIGFDGPVLVSSDIAARKPDRPAFEGLARALGLRPADVAYVGDSPSIDVIGARAAGMIGVWLDAEGAIYPQDAPQPSAVIHNLHQVLGVVRP